MLATPESLHVDADALQPYAACSRLYQQLVDKAREAHKQGRRADLFERDEVDLARLFTYAYRTQTIGAFHATRVALLPHLNRSTSAAAHVLRAVEQLEDLANFGMERIPDDFRVVLSNLARYHCGVRRVVDALDQAQRSSGDRELGRIGERFASIVGEIQCSNGIYLTQDREAPELGSFVVPNLGILIVPLVYGDHHSWNLAYLTPEHLDVPNHLHHFGVEIHLGYEPLEGYMVLGDAKAPVNEGYALPIPSETRHGWINTSGQVHHVPFIFGSLIHSGWGVFLDVDPKPAAVDDLETVDREHWKMGDAIFLEREINRLATSMTAQRSVLIPAMVTDRNGTGGLELAASRANDFGFAYPVDQYRAGSVVRGRGMLRIGPVEREIHPHDHFGVPAGMTAAIQQVGEEPLVVLDTVIRAM